MHSGSKFTFITSGAIMILQTTTSWKDVVTVTAKVMLINSNAGSPFKTNSQNSFYTHTKSMGL